LQSILSCPKLAPGSIVSFSGRAVRLETMRTQPSAYRGKTALIYDVMEPLHPVMDRCILRLVQAHIFERTDLQISSDGACRLDPELAIA
jgi:hypothetical protein